MGTPIHEHDCEKCIYLGSDKEKSMDYYIHKSEDPFNTTLIARFGEMGDYMSGCYFYLSNPAINRAGNLAIDQGFITVEELSVQLNKAIFEPVVLDESKFRSIYS